MTLKGPFDLVGHWARPKAMAPIGQGDDYWFSQGHWRNGPRWHPEGVGSGGGRPHKLSLLVTLVMKQAQPASHLVR